uniref:EamA family transporter n=1 Tax=Klebsiella pneumoniae TaxID=573 RepID=UPI0013D7A5CB
LLAFVLWNRCIATLGPSLTGASFHLVALFTALLAFALLGEPVRAFHMVGAVLILGGFILATLRWPAVPAATGLMERPQADLTRKA